MHRTIEDEIRELERQIEELTASRPAHDFTGAYQMQLLEIEEQLDEKKKARRRAAGGTAPSTDSTSKG